MTQEPVANGEYSNVGLIATRCCGSTRKPGSGRFPGRALQVPEWQGAGAGTPLSAKQKGALVLARQISQRLSKQTAPLGSRFQVASLGKLGPGDGLDCHV
jgi:hypothetical protein